MQAFTVALFLINESCVHHTIILTSLTHSLTRSLTFAHTHERAHTYKFTCSVLAPISGFCDRLREPRVLKGEKLPGSTCLMVQRLR